MVKINAGLTMTLIKNVAQDIINLSEEEKQKYRISPIMISTAQRAIKITKSRRHNYNVWMNSKDVTDILWTFFYADRLQSLKHEEDITEWRKMLESANEVSQKWEELWEEREEHERQLEEERAKH